MEENTAESKRLAHYLQLQGGGVDLALPSSGEFVQH